MNNHHHPYDPHRGDYTCAFCGKTGDLVNAMISGPNGIYICDECISVCADAMMRDMGYTMAQEFEPVDDGRFGGGWGRWGNPPEAEMVREESPVVDDGPSPAEVLGDLPTPHELYARLSEHVVGQEEAKRALSVAVYNHYKRISMGEAAAEGDVELAKSNIMLIGPTLTEAGYVGEDVENILLKLITAADFEVPRAEIGIIYIDEIDKIARKAENLSITRDVSGEGVQQALLKIVEGCEASVPPQGGRKHPQQELIPIDTTNILFILGGAFVGLADIVASRVGTTSLGFASELAASKKESEAELLRQVLPEELNKYGMIPEFVGRIPVITSLNELSEEDLVRILVEPKNALVKQYTRMFEFEDCRLAFDKAALTAIAHEAVEHGTGARGLRSICERVLMDVMYDLPEFDGASQVTVRASDITGETKPVIKPRANIEGALHAS